MLRSVRLIYGLNSLAESTITSPSKRSRYKPEHKEHVLSLFSQLKSYGEVEKLTGVSRNTIRSWHQKSIRV